MWSSQHVLVIFVFVSTIIGPFSNANADPEQENRDFMHEISEDITMEELIEFREEVREEVVPWYCFGLGSTASVASADLENWENHVVTIGSAIIRGDDPLKIPGLLEAIAADTPTDNPLAFVEINLAALSRARQVLDTGIRGEVTSRVLPQTGAVFQSIAPALVPLKLRISWVGFVVYGLATLLLAFSILFVIRVARGREGSQSS